MAHYTKLEDGSYACSCGGSTTLRFRGSTFVGCDACLTSSPDHVRLPSAFLEAIAKDSKIASSTEVRELALDLLECRRIVGALESKIEQLEGEARTWQVRAERVERALNVREERMITARDERAREEAKDAKPHSKLIAEYENVIEHLRKQLNLFARERGVKYPSPTSKSPRYPRCAGPAAGNASRICTSGRWDC